MTLGMILGIALSPIMMKVIKNFRQRRKVKKILQEHVNNRKMKLMMIIIEISNYKKINYNLLVYILIIF